MTFNTAPPKYNTKTWPERPKRVRTKPKLPEIRFRVDEDRITEFGHFLQYNRVSYQKASVALGCSLQYVQMLATGRCVPSLIAAARIEKWSRLVDPEGPVLMQSWVTLIPRRELVLGRSEI